MYYEKDYVFVTKNSKKRINLTYESSNTFYGILILVNCSAILSNSLNTNKETLIDVNDNNIYTIPLGIYKSTNTSQSPNGSSWLYTYSGYCELYDYVNGGNIRKAKTEWNISSNSSYHGSEGQFYFDIFTYNKSNAAFWLLKPHIINNLFNWRRNNS